MLGRLTQSVRAAIYEPSCAGGFVEAWVGRRTSVRRGVDRRCGGEALADFRRLILWASSSVIRTRGYPGDAAIDEQVVAMFNAADPATHERLTAELSRMIDEPSASPFPHALRLAGRIPVPQARKLLLGYLTGSRNHSRCEFDPRPPALRALGQLRQRELRTIFTTLIERHAQRALWDATARAILHQAGWSLCRIDPNAFADELPWSLQNDPLFLTDVLTDPPVRAVVQRWLDGLPSDRAVVLQPWISNVIPS